MKVVFDYECEKCGFVTEREGAENVEPCDICGEPVHRLPPTTVAIHIPSDFSTRTRK